MLGLSGHLPRQVEDLYRAFRFGDRQGVGNPASPQRKMIDRDNVAIVSLFNSDTLNGLRGHLSHIASCGIHLVLDTGVSARGT